MSKSTGAMDVAKGEVIGRVIMVVAGIVALVVLGVITVFYQVEIVLPQKMAERNYCWRELPTSDQHAYQPCEAAGGTK